jgi:predicted dehydrogenase
VAKRSFTVGVIGLGFGRAHIPAFQANGCEVIAVCQRDQASATAIAKRHGVPQVFEGWEEMLERARPDIVSIAAPPSLHRAIALAAFAQGAHVLCEKPLAMTAAEARDMIAAAAQAGRVGMTAFNWRFLSAMQRFHEMAEAGHVGRLFHLHGDWLGARWADESAASTWRMDRAAAGHGAMGDMGVHLVDLVRWSFGEFTRVAALGAVAHPSRTVPGGARSADAEDYCSVLGELASGGQVTLVASRAARGGNGHGLDAYGASGALSYRVDRASPRWFRGELRAASGDGAMMPVKVPSGLPRSAAEGDPMEVTGKTTIAPLVKRFLGAIRKGEPVSPSFQDGARAQAVLDAVLESESRGGWVPVAPAS